MSLALLQLRSRHAGVGGAARGELDGEPSGALDIAYKKRTA